MKFVLKTNEPVYIFSSLFNKDTLIIRLICLGADIRRIENGIEYLGEEITICETLNDFSDKNKLTVYTGTWTEEDLNKLKELGKHVISDKDLIEKCVPKN